MSTANFFVLPVPPPAKRKRWMRDPLQMGSGNPSSKLSCTLQRGQNWILVADSAQEPRNTFSLLLLFNLDIQ